MAGDKDLSKVEHIKQGSAGLRGRIGEELADPDTAAFAADTAQVLKFHGIYQQDDRDVRRERSKRGLGRDHICMVRASIPGGALSTEQYLVMDELADKVGNGTLRVTTRQGLQYHFTRKGQLRDLVRTLNTHLVTTLAACGDVVRNVMCCPAPATGREEAAVQQLAAGLSRALKPRTRSYWQLWVDGERAASAEAPEGEGASPEPVDPLYGPTYLPRKFKVGVAFPGDNCIDVYTQDIGIVPHLAGGEVEACTLVVGGGLGMTHNNPSTYPRLADPLCTVAPGELLDVVTAVIGVQRDHGDRTDRKHARMKYLVADWGIDAFRAEVGSRLGWSLADPRPLAWGETGDHLGWREEAAGRWTLGVPVPSGRIEDGPTELRRGLREAVARFAGGVRFTPRQDVLLTGIAETDRSRVETVLARSGIRLADAFAPVERHALACPALPTCGLAIAEAERILPAVVDDVQGTLVRLGLGRDSVHVRVTGCPNGCARPYSTEIGIVGRGADHYTVLLGGDADGTRLNTVFADRVARADIAAVLTPPLARWRGERLPGEAFGDFCDRVGVAALAGGGRST